MSEVDKHEGHPNLFKITFEINDNNFEAAILIIVNDNCEKAWGFDTAAIQAKKILDVIYEDRQGAMIIKIEHLYYSLFDIDGSRLH